MDRLETMAKNQYLNIETVRKSGVAVRTPVWFVQDGEKILVRTVANSGKVKRIRNNANVKIAPCKVDGALLGDWLPALAHEVRDEETASKVDKLLDKKYGLMKKLFAISASLQGRNYTVLQIEIRE